MNRVTVVLPALVVQATGTGPRVEVAGHDTDEVLAALFAAHPKVRTHLVDGSGRLRRNVLCSIDDVATRLRTPAPVTDESVVRFVASVAGGS